MDFLNELFGSEMGELKRHQKVSILNLSYPLLIPASLPRLKKRSRSFVQMKTSQSYRGLCISSKKAMRFKKYL